jgi:hypothetical protein
MEEGHLNTVKPSVRGYPYLLLPGITGPKGVLKLVILLLRAVMDSVYDSTYRYSNR